MTGLALRPNLATIAPNLPFLDALATWWLSRRSGDPLAVAEGVFLLPTRRAARGLSEAFLRQSDGKPLLLPRILALGGVDEAPLALEGALDLAPAVPAPRRLAVLTRFILAMDGANGAPAEADRAWALAVELAALLDEAGRAEIDLAHALPKAVSEAFAAHWQITLRFLTIVTQAWPDYLAGDGLADIGVRQVALLDAQARAWRDRPPASAVIAAGTTGAIPAVARLLRVVAHLPHGMVVLPGLDLDLDDASWQALDETHPQASLRHLLAALDATRGDVRAWPDVAGEARVTVPGPVSSAGRIDAWRVALLPAATLSAWQAPPPFDTAGLERLEPGDQQEEALCIALVMRDAVERPGTRAALVTPDRSLARRVAAELLRFGIIADDSAGEPLAETPPAVFLRLLAAAYASNLRPVDLLALLKHPLCALGLSQSACREQARRLERARLRGPRPPPGLAGLRAGQAPADFLARIEQALAALSALPRDDVVAPAAMLVALLQAAEAFAATDRESGADRLWQGEEGEALSAHLAAQYDALGVLPPQGIPVLPGLLDALLEGAAVRSRRALRGRDGAEHPRIAIWGLLEARLQSADVMVLGGLCEGVWPESPESGPWMNRPMRRAIGLPAPEERVGLSAHDFVMACCAATRVILSAPRRRDGAPAVPSRWLVRLDALLAGLNRPQFRHPAPLWARALDRPAGPPCPVKPPAPTPPVALRPRRLSVTEIETFLRDPYAIYAKHVLRLKKLDPLEQAADASDFGSIVHAALARFVRRNATSFPTDARTQLAQDMEACLQDAALRPSLAAWWRPRLRRIADWVAVAEAERRSARRLAHLEAECPGAWTFPAPGGDFTLKGRADRIERRVDGTLAILDYKTGTPPNAKQVEDGRAPQLPVEAAMAKAGAFGEALQGDVAELTYWQISGGFEPGKCLVLFKGNALLTMDAAIQAGANVQALVAAFDSPHRAYLSQPSPGAAPRFSDYTRLARVAEWAAVDESD